VHGILATHASELSPLTDTDAAICARMDSAFVTPPSYYMRAGSYILAYNAPPLGQGHRLIIYEGPTLFVFDSAGGEYYVPGSVAQKGPMNLRAKAAPTGQVALIWTNQPRDNVTYRVQRAVGSDAFIDLGVPIARADTTATDTAARKGNTYRYRIAAIMAGGAYTYYSNVIAVDLSH
jgi:hypothetical protein